MKSLISGTWLVVMLLISSCTKERVQVFSISGDSSIAQPVGPVIGNGSSTKGIPSNAVIQGIISPIIANPVLTLFNSKYFQAIPLQGDGSFQVNNLPDGLYNLLIDANNGFKDTLLIAIPAKQTVKTDLGTIQLLN